MAQFGNNRSSRDGLTAYCKPCHNVKTQESRARNGGHRNYHLLRRYGITAAQADEMLEAQGGLCAICRTKPADHVDHCHLTGDVRGLLCFTCNAGLGNFGDSEQLLRLAADYLRGHQMTDPSVIDDGAAWDFSGGYTEGA